MTTPVWAVMKPVGCSTFVDRIQAFGSRLAAELAGVPLATEPAGVALGPGPAQAAPSSASMAGRASRADGPTGRRSDRVVVAVRPKRLDLHDPRGRRGSFPGDAAAALLAEIRLADHFILAQIGGCPRKGALAGLQDVAPVGHDQGLQRVLLDEQDRRAGGIDLLDDGKDLLDKNWR